MPPLLSGPTVTTQWLADHLGADDLLILDATVLVVRDAEDAPAFISGYDRYLLDGHLPGAVFADLIDVFSDPHAAHPFTRPDVAAFERAAASVGITQAHTVVVYDSGGGSWAARLWWLLLSFGVDTVAVLDGGLTAWLVEGREVDAGHIEPAPGSIVARPRPRLWADKAEVERVVAGTQPSVLVCGAPARVFSGHTPVSRRAGHIPASVSVPASRLVDRNTARFLSADRLRALYPPAVHDAGRVITYCTGGIGAAANALSLVLAGLSDVAVFDGSLQEWSSDPESPLGTA